MQVKTLGAAGTPGSTGASYSGTGGAGTAGGEAKAKNTGGYPSNRSGRAYGGCPGRGRRSRRYPDPRAPGRTPGPGTALSGYGGNGEAAKATASNSLYVIGQTTSTAKAVGERRRRGRVGRGGRAGRCR